VRGDLSRNLSFGRVEAVRGGWIFEPQEPKKAGQAREKRT
jgi:hypothetical protein